MRSIAAITARRLKSFADPMWRGIAAYRALDFLTAAQSSARSRAWRAGSRWVMPRRKPCLGKVDQGVRRGAGAEPGHLAAKTNRAIVERLFRSAGGKTPQAGEGEARRPTRRRTRCASIPSRRAASAFRCRPRTSPRRRCGSLDARGADVAGGFPEAEIRHPGRGSAPSPGGRQ